MPTLEQESTQTYQVFDLKKGVDFIGVTCTFWCHDGRGNLLLQKRSQQCRDERGRWDCGGGSVEFGEQGDDFEAVVRREIMEELGVEPIEVKQIRATNVLRVNDDGRPTHWIAIVHTALMPTQGARIGEPHKTDEIGWFPIDALPEPRHSQWDRHFALVRPFLVP